MTLLSFHSLTLGLLFNGLAKAYLHKDTQLVAHRELSSNTCNANTPCVSGVCCSTSGSCGYGPAFCGAGNCLSNCDAKPECGQYAAPGSEACPLNICCSKYGSCGTSQDFCGEGCQSNCAPPTKPTCDASFTASQRIVGYYESWAHGRPCQTVAPEDLNATGFTHINYGFLLFDPSTFAIAPADEGAMPLATRFTDLKTSNPGLKTWVSVGGWSFNDPGPTLTAFSDMVGSPANRTNFITELMHFMDAYAFDGVDLDWEYPVASDRGGKPADKENYVFFCNELRIALGPKYGLSVTLPMSPFYLRNFDVERLQSSVDWFNVMSYDMHGVWDKNQGEAFIRPHSNITEIDEGLDVFWRAKVAPSKVNLGLAWYGRSFALESSNCSTPDGACKFTGAGSSGPCSNVPGTLNLAEIQDLVAQQKVKPSFDKLAGVKWMTYNTSQWVSYDDAETVKLKQAYANSRCLGGTMVWAMDQVYQKSACELAPARRPTVSTSLSSSAGNGSTTSCLGQMISTSVSPTRRALTSLGRTTFSRHSNATSACSTLSQKHGVSTSTLQVLSGNLACTFTNSACLPKPCTLSYLHTNTTCTALAASLKNVTEAQLKTWNPALVSGDCANVQSGQHVCISPPGGWYTCARPPGLAGSGGSGSSSSGAATGTESAGAAMKTQPGIASNCNAYATVTSGDTCLALASAHGISPNDLYAWNAVLGKDEAACATALWSGESYCVGTGAIAGSNSSTAATFQPPFANTTASSSAVLASSTGHVTAYTTKTVYHTTTLFAFDSSRSSTSTTSSTSAVFTYDQTTSPFSYNPTTLLTTPSSSSPRPPPTASTSTSPVSIDSHTLTTNPVPSSSSASPPPQPTAPSSPSLLRPGTAASCAKFAQAQPLDTCLNFAATYGISPEEFYSWNPVLGEGGEDCAVGLWAGFYYCVGLVSE